mgnify:FL=1
MLRLQLVLTSEHTLVVHFIVVLSRVGLFCVDLVGFATALKVEIVLNLGARNVWPFVRGEGCIQGRRCLVAVVEVRYFVVRCASDFLIIADGGMISCALMVVSCQP